MLTIGKLETSIYKYTETLKDNTDELKSNIEVNKDYIKKTKDEFDDYYDYLERQRDDEFKDFKRLQEDKISELDKSLKKLRRAYDKSEFKEDDKEILSNINKLEIEKTKLAIDNSLKICWGVMSLYFRLARFSVSLSRN